MVHKQGSTYWWLLDGYSRTATAVLPTIHKKPRASVQVFQLRHLAFISWNDVRNGDDEALVFVDGMSWMFGYAIRVLLHGGETCRVRMAERRRAPDTVVPLVVIAMSRGPPLSTSMGCCACPTPSAVSVHLALRVGISGAELIGQEYIRNVPVFGEVLPGCRCLATRLERFLGRQARHSDSSLQLGHSNVYYNAICSLLTFIVPFAWTWNQVSASSTSFGRCGVSAVGFALWC